MSYKLHRWLWGIHDMQTGFQDRGNSEKKRQIRSHSKLTYTLSFNFLLSKEIYLNIKKHNILCFSCCLLHCKIIYHNYKNAMWENRSSYQLCLLFLDTGLTFNELERTVLNLQTHLPRNIQCKCILIL